MCSRYNTDIFKKETSALAHSFNRTVIFSAFTVLSITHTAFCIISSGVGFKSSFISGDNVLNNLAIC